MAVPENLIVALALASVLVLCAADTAPLTNDDFCHGEGGKCGPKSECLALGGTPKPQLCTGPKDRMCCTDIPPKPTRAPTSAPKPVQPEKEEKSWWETAKGHFVSGAHHLKKAAMHYSGYNAAKQVYHSVRSYWGSSTPPTTKPVSKEEVPIPDLKSLFGGKKVVGGDDKKEEKATPTPKVYTTPTYQENDVVIVISSALNFREKPNGEKIGDARPKGTKFVVLETGKGWLHVRPLLDHLRHGYIYASTKYIEKSQDDMEEMTLVPGFTKLKGKHIPLCVLESARTYDHSNPNAVGNGGGYLYPGTRVYWTGRARKFIKMQVDKVARVLLQCRQMSKPKNFWIEYQFIKPCPVGSDLARKYPDWEGKTPQLGSLSINDGFKALLQPKKRFSGMRFDLESGKIKHDNFGPLNGERILSPRLACARNDIVLLKEPDNESEFLGVIPLRSILKVRGEVPRLGTASSIQNIIRQMYARVQVDSLPASAADNEDAKKLIGVEGYVTASLIGTYPCAFSKVETEAALTALNAKKAVKGAWVPPQCALDIGDKAQIKYDDSPAFGPGKSCPNKEPTMAVRALTLELIKRFPGIQSIGGYSCRPNTADTSKMSVHGSGRAMDIMIPLVNGDADNSVGDAIANWLVQHSKAVGVQYIAWDRWSWGGSRRAGKKARKYGGPNPHIDHLHVEINEEAAAKSKKLGSTATTWFDKGLWDERCWVPKYEKMSNPFAQVGATAGGTGLAAGAATAAGETLSGNDA